MADRSGKITQWSRIENDGSGDYYLVPDGLFPYSLEENDWDDPEVQRKMEQCVYIGGFPSDVLIKGEWKDD